MNNMPSFSHTPSINFNELDLFNLEENDEILNYHSDSDLGINNLLAVPNDFSVSWFLQEEPEVSSSPATTSELMIAPSSGETTHNLLPLEKFFLSLIRNHTISKLKFTGNYVNLKNLATTEFSDVILLKIFQTILTEFPSEFFASSFSLTEKISRLEQKIQEKLKRLIKFPENEPFCFHVNYTLSNSQESQEKIYAQLKTYYILLHIAEAKISEYKVFIDFLMKIDGKENGETNFLDLIFLFSIFTPTKKYNFADFIKSSDDHFYTINQVFENFDSALNTKLSIDKKEDAENSEKIFQAIHFEKTLGSSSQNTDIEIVQQTNSNPLKRANPNTDNQDSLTSKKRKTQHPTSSLRTFSIPQALLKTHSSSSTAQSQNSSALLQTLASENSNAAVLAEVVANSQEESHNLEHTDLAILAEVVRQESPLLNEEIIAYPITEKIQKVEITPFPLLNDSLKGYQKKEVTKLINYANNGISRVLAFEMGLGKTFVYAEYLAQMFLAKERSSFVVVPKSLLLTICADLKEYFANICGQAWNKSWKTTQDKDKYIDDFIVHLKKDPSNILFSLRALGSIAKDKKYFNILCQKIENSSIFSQSTISKDFLETSLSKHFSGLENDKQISGRPISTKVYQALLEYYQRQGIENTDLISKVDIDKFFSGSVTSLEIQEKLVEDQISLLSLCALIGQLLDISPQPIENDCAPLNDRQLEKLKMLSVDEIFEPEASSKKLLNSIKKAHTSKEQKIFISTYDCLKAIPHNEIKKYPFACVVLDEAQKVHTKGTIINKYLSKMSSEMSETTSWLAVTGTPFENNFTELWNLFSITNPGNFSNATQYKLNDSLKSLLKQMQGEDIDKADFDKLSKEFVKVFGYIENFRQHIAMPLTGYLKKENEEVVREWKGKLASRNDQIIPIDSEALINYEKELLQTTKNFIKIDLKIQQALVGIHSDSFNSENKEVENIVALFKKNDVAKKNDYLNKAPLIKELLKTKVLKEISQQEKGRAIILTKHLAIAKIVQAALANAYQLKEEQLPIYEGSLKSNQRKKIITQFKNVTANPMILILMEKAGGLGLNLPEASAVVKLSPNHYNPCFDEQSIARVFRVGNEGVKTILSFSANLFMEAHSEVVQKKKRAWTHLFSEEKIENLGEQFKRFIHAIEAECHHSILNEKKNIEEAQKRLAVVTQVLAKLQERVTPEDLNNVMSTLSPKISETVEQEHQEPLLVVEQPEPMEEVSVDPLQQQDQEFFLHREFLLESDFSILPLPKAYQNNLVACCHALKTMDKSLISEALQELKNNQPLRKACRKGLSAVLDFTEDPRSSLLMLLTNLPRTTLENIPSYNFGIYTYNPEEKIYALLDQKNPESKDLILLYKPKSQNIDGKTHYDLLIPNNF